MELVPLKEMVEMLRKKRQRNGIKQKKAASVAKMSASQVNRIENQTTNPTYQSVYELWRALETLENEQKETAEELMNSPITWCKPDETVEEVSRKMRENDFSQLPVKQDGEVVGLVSDKHIMQASDPDTQAIERMSSAPLEVNPDTTHDVIREILKEDPAVLVKNSNGYLGIITKSDML